MSEKMLTLLIVLFIEFNNFSSGLEKHWLPNQEWNSENNWLEKRIPDMESHIIFPLEMRHAVGLPFEGPLRMSEIDLPADGILVLSKNGGLQIMDKSRKSKKIGTWSKEGQLFWADPYNWNSTSDAVPHLERIPCQMDKIVLPNKYRVFNMRLPMKSVKIKGISLGIEEMGISEWNHRIHSREFANQQKSIGYSNFDRCERCSCQEGRQSDYLEEVCDIQRPRCGHPICVNPLKVEGHCCYYCGARLSVSKNVYTRFLNRLTNEALNPYYASISWYVRTTWDGNLEILITEKGQYSGINSRHALQSLKESLIREGIEILFTESAGGFIQQYAISTILGPIFGGLFFALFLLIIICLYNGYSYTQIFQGTRDIWFSIRNGTRGDNSKENSYKFARFQNLPEGNVQLSGADKLEINAIDNEPCSSGGRFENPLYKSKRESKKEVEKEDLKGFNFNCPVSLVTLKNTIQGDNLEEVEMLVEEISETEQ